MPKPYTGCAEAAALHSVAAPHQGASNRSAALTLAVQSGSAVMQRPPSRSCAFPSSPAGFVRQLFVLRRVRAGRRAHCGFGHAPILDAPGSSSELLVEHTMNYLSRLEEGLAEALGPWTYLHSVGAAVALLLAIGIAVNIWPGWQQVGGWLW